MSNERKNPGQDKLVADTYRAVARERVPDHLNERVLRLAADAGRTPYARARAWMRPAAWAATIGLSLAIVLELTQLPQIEPVPVSITSSDQSAVPGETANDEDIVREDNATAIQAEAPSPEPPAGRGDTQRSGPATPAAEQQSREAMDQFAPKDMSVLRDAENRARLQAGPDQPSAATEAEAMQDVTEIDERAVEEVVVKEVVLDEEMSTAPMADFPAARSLAATVDRKEATADSSCSADARKNAESWYICIEELRDRGLDELANGEYENFRRNFPDFVDPGAE